MQTWRRTFVTSCSRLNHSSPGHSPGPTLVRCAQILQACDRNPRAYVDQQIKINGFVRTVRKQKHCAFVDVSDGSYYGRVQAVFKPEDAAQLSTGTALEMTGIWRANAPGYSQRHDLHVTKMNIVGEADGTYPVQKKYHTPEFLRTIPHLRIRTPLNSLLARFRSECIYQLGNILHPAFVQVQPPVITSSDCEGAGETFAVIPRETLGSGRLPRAEKDHFFRAPKYLSVSSQLHLEAYAAELGNVWTLAPVFRAERSDTPRHLSEFYMLEAEVNFLSDLDALTDTVEALLRDLTRQLYKTLPAEEIICRKRESNPESAEEIAGNLRQRWLDLMDGPKWRRITYTDAITELQAAVSAGDVVFEHAPTWSGGLNFEHERYLVDILNMGEPVFVTDYPKAIKPFYMSPSQNSTTSAEAESGNATVACFDLLLPGIGEVAGGSLREHRLPELIQNMREHGLIKTNAKSKKKPTYPHLLPGEDLGHLQWYADLRRWGSAPHGGFGIGFDRFLGYLTGVSSIRDTVPFPRYFGKADC